MQNNKNNFNVILVVAIVAAIIIGGVVGFSVVSLMDKDDNSTSNGNNQTIKTNTGSVKIVQSENKKIEYETFDNGKIKLQIPKGWKVYIPNVVTYSGYAFRVYNPDNTDIGYMFSLAVSGFPKSEAARAKFYSLYPSAVFGNLAAVDPQTTEAFYKVWEKNAKYANETQLKEDFFIVTTNWTMIENIGKSPIGGDIIRATYSNSKGEKLQGLFTATVVDTGSYKEFGLDLAPLKSYHNIIMHAPDAEFSNWASILNYSISTIEFSDDFMTGFNREQAAQISAVRANAKIYDEMSDMIMDSWNKRNNSYDIISQKQSDATLGYERVYDTETGEVYKAYNGFTDDYQGERYKAISEDMYTKSISGYIEK